MSIRARFNRALALAGLLVLLAGACTPGDDGGSLLENGALKATPAGLYLVNGPGETFPFIDHAVIGDDWAALEPSRDEFTGPGWERIDSALESYPEYSFRLRIQMGRQSPDWVKTLGGGCVQVTQPASGLSACVPRFWTEDYLDEYSELMAEIARRYDAEPRILDVVNSACMTMWAEPFIRVGDDVDSNRALSSAGLNESSDRNCLERSTMDMASAFRHTRISLATHLQWQIVLPDGVERSWAKERELLDDLRVDLGDKLIVQNNGLGGDEGCHNASSSGPMWCWLDAVEPPKGMQTEGDQKLAVKGLSIFDAIDRGLALGACFIEHNSFGQDKDLARQADRRLKANC